ncbi:hypothetical protein D5086_015089 [Populus alba]|uniref:Uncharacterized protein n=1 Tax=Populus alba TaxID=43335 RepID=A0ACC4C272_POPAL
MASITQNLNTLWLQRLLFQILVRLMEKIIESQGKTRACFGDLSISFGPSGTKGTIEYGTMGLRQSIEWLRLDMVCKWYDWPQHFRFHIPNLISLILSIHFLKFISFFEDSVKFRSRIQSEAVNHYGIDGGIEPQFQVK